MAYSGILNTLAQNEECNDSVLYVFCYGTKENKSREILITIVEVRRIIKQENKSKKVENLRDNDHYNFLICNKETVNSRNH